jgi:hypothetical protein
MSSFKLPQLPDIDRMAERAEAREQARRARIRPAHLRQDLVHAFADAIAAHAGGPLGDLVAMLIEEPIRDEEDLAQFVKSQGAQDGPRLAKALLALAGRVSLRHYRQADDTMF